MSALDRLPQAHRMFVNSARLYGWHWHVSGDGICLTAPDDGYTIHISAHTALNTLGELDHLLAEHGTMPTKEPRKEPPMSDITAEVIEVTPEMALEWLTDPAYKAPNRTLRKSKLAQYVDAMRRGQWRVTGEAIKFDINGQLRDGQHRLTAVIDSGVTISTMVVRGIEEDTQDVMDTGAARSPSDVLTIHGHRNASLVAAAARILVAIEMDRFNIGQENARASNDEVLDYATRHPELGELVGVCQQDIRLTPVRASIALAALAAMSHVDREEAMEFWNRLAHGHQLETNNPILTLRQRLNKIQAERERHSQYTLMSLLMRTFDSWRRGETLAKVLLYKNDRPIPIPTLAPKP